MATLVKSRYAVAFAEKAEMANRYFIPPHTLRQGKLNERVGLGKERKPPQPGYVIRVEPKHPRKITHLFLTGGLLPMGSLKTQALRFAKVFETYQEALDFLEEFGYLLLTPATVCWTPNRYSHQYEVVVPPDEEEQEVEEQQPVVQKPQVQQQPRAEKTYFFASFQV